MELGYQAPDTAREYAAYLADAFKNVFRPPVPFGLTAWRHAERTSDNAAVPAIAAEVMVVVRPNGELRRLAFSQTSLVPAIDDALAAAVKASVKEGPVPHPEHLGIKRDLTLFFSITLDPKPPVATPSPRDRAAVEAARNPVRRAVEQPVVILHLPTARFTSVVMANDKESKPVRFPSELLSARVEGFVTIQFVVGRDGRIAPGTIRLLDTTDRGFAAGVYRATEGLRFIPGEIARCPVPVLVTQSFAFRIGRP